MSVLVLCKFTPLGFETSYIPKVSNDIISVNLPRWGLKHLEEEITHQLKQCKFTPLGFETVPIFRNTRHSRV